MASPQESYLGDGLYVSFDGYQIWLRAPRDGGDHVVALEPNTLAKLEAYVADLMRPVAVVTAGNDTHG